MKRYKFTFVADDGETLEIYRSFAYRIRAAIFKEGALAALQGLQPGSKWEAMRMEIDHAAR